MTEVMSYHNFDGPGSLPPGSSELPPDAMQTAWYNTSSVSILARVISTYWN